MSRLRRFSLLAGLSALFPLSALAHPGHDDGHELTWDFGHLVAHPFATLLCFSVLGLAAWVTWRIVVWSEASRPEERAQLRKD